MPVAGRVLADQSQLAHSTVCQRPPLADHRFKATRPEAATHLRNHAEAAGVITALSNLQIRRIGRGGQNTRSEVGIKIGIVRGIETAAVINGVTSFEYAFELVGSDYKIDFRDLIQNILAISLD